MCFFAVQKSKTTDNAKKIADLEKRLQDVSGKLGGGKPKQAAAAAAAAARGKGTDILRHE